MTVTRDHPMSNDQELLEMCIRSGQVSAAQIEAHRRDNVVPLRPEKPPDDEDAAARRRLELIRRNRAALLRLVYEIKGEHGQLIAAQLVTEVSAEVLGL